MEMLVPAPEAASVWSIKNSESMRASRVGNVRNLE